MSDRLSVHGRTVCITGSSSGMGRAFAEHLGALGATVYLMGRNAEPMEESKARIEAAGGKADLATFDLIDTAALQAWIQPAVVETGRLDVMINNAGFGDFGTSFLEGDPDIWKGMLDVNVLAAGSQGRSRRNAGHRVAGQHQFGLGDSARFRDARGYQARGQLHQRKPAK